MKCIFCQILESRDEASFVYEDELVVGIMSLDQPNPYKVLVVSRAHRETLYDLLPNESARIFQVAARIARAIRDASNCDGLNVVQSNGKAGQQDVFHFHIHLLPRFDGDDVQIKWPESPVPRTQLDDLARQIRSRLDI